jgi:hypothetical protein
LLPDLPDEPVSSGNPIKGREIAGDPHDVKDRREPCVATPPVERLASIHGRPNAASTRLKASTMIDGVSGDCSPRATRAESLPTSRSSRQSECPHRSRRTITQWRPQAAAATAVFAESGGSCRRSFDQLCEQPADGAQRARTTLRRSRTSAGSMRRSSIITDAPRLTGRRPGLRLLDIERSSVSGPVVSCNVHR